MVIVQLTAFQPAFLVEHEVRPPLDIEFGSNLSIEWSEMPRESGLFSELSDVHPRSRAAMFFLNPTHPIGHAAMVTVVDSRRWAGKCKLVGQKSRQRS
jgi:hypothetical protein